MQVCFKEFIKKLNTFSIFIKQHTKTIERLWGDLQKHVKKRGKFKQTQMRSLSLFVFAKMS